MKKISPSQNFSIFYEGDCILSPSGNNKIDLNLKDYNSDSCLILSVPSEDHKKTIEDIQNEISEKWEMIQYAHKKFFDDPQDKEQHPYTEEDVEELINYGLKSGEIKKQLDKGIKKQEIVDRFLFVK